MKLTSAILILAAVLPFYGSSPARADTSVLPGSIPAELLSDSSPGALAPGDIEAADFEVEWEGARPPGISVSLDRQSVQWVRLAGVLVLPRGRLSIQVTGFSSGVVSHAGYSQPLATAGNSLRAEIPIALLSADPSRVTLRLARELKTQEYRFHLRFRPRSPARAAKVFIDTSCSPFGVEAELRSLKSVDWGFVGCRLVQSRGDGIRVPSLEIFAYWDGASDATSVAGVVTPASLVGVPVWAFRLRKEPGFIELTRGDRRIRLKYSIAERLYRFSIAAGAGPYTYGFESPTGDLHTIAPLLTIYAGYTLSDSVRLVAFDAMPLSSRFYTDLGVYVNTEQFRALDTRLSLNLNLGAHLLVFHTPQGEVYKYGLPQGFELNLRDALLRGYSLGMGAFLYPTINGKEYYNAWVRYGTRGIFAEINYILWKEQVQSANYSSRSFGLSIGFPLIRLF